jgi:hypothetical protein
MWQEITIGLLFTIALFYLGRMVYRQFTKKEGCEAGCSCSGSISIDDIEEKLKKDKRFEKSSGQ